MSQYDRYKRLNNIYGETISEESTNKGREDFECMLENKLSPTVYDVGVRVNRKEDVDSLIILPADIANVSNNDQKSFDEKYVKFTYDADVTIGSIVTWKDKNWMMIHEEEMSYNIYQHYTMKWCNNTFRFKLNGIVHEFPIVVSNLTLYSDGMSDMVYISTQDGKRNILVSDNILTRNIKIDTRIMLTNSTVYRVTHIDDFTQKGVKNMTVIQTTLHSLDDLENNIAYNDNSESENIPSGHYIDGENIIYIGSFSEYFVGNIDMYSQYDWKVSDDFIYIEKNNDKCTVKCSGDSDYIGREFTLTLLKNNDIIDKKMIKVRGFS